MYPSLEMGGFQIVVDMNLLYWKRFLAIYHSIALALGVRSMAEIIPCDCDESLVYEQNRCPGPARQTL